MDLQSRKFQCEKDIEALQKKLVEIKEQMEEKKLLVDIGASKKIYHEGSWFLAGCSLYMLSQVASYTYKLIGQYGNRKSDREMKNGTNGFTLQEIEIAVEDYLTPVKVNITRV